MWRYCGCWFVVFNVTLMDSATKFISRHFSAGISARGSGPRRFSIAWHHWGERGIRRLPINLCEGKGRGEVSKSNVSFMRTEVLKNEYAG